MQFPSETKDRLLTPTSVQILTANTHSDPTFCSFLRASTYDAVVQVVDFQTCIKTREVSSDVCCVSSQVDETETSP